MHRIEKHFLNKTNLVLKGEIAGNSIVSLSYFIVKPLINCFR